MSNSSGKFLVSIASAVLIGVSATVAADSLSIQSISSAQLDEIVREQEQARYMRQAQNQVRTIQPDSVSEGVYGQAREREQKRYRLHAAGGNGALVGQGHNRVLAGGNASPTMKPKGNRSGGGRK